MNDFPSIPMTTEETIEFNKWLEEHDKQIRAEAIDEFAEKIKAYSGEHYIDCDGNPYGCKTDLVFMTDAFLDDIVKQLKEQK